MNSAPSSIGILEEESWMVNTLPPMRSRASMIETDMPADASSSAADSPETPAPTMTTSELMGIYARDAKASRDAALMVPKAETENKVGQAEIENGQVRTPALTYGWVLLVGGQCRFVLSCLESLKTFVDFVPVHYTPPCS